MLKHFVGEQTSADNFWLADYSQAAHKIGPLLEIGRNYDPDGCPADWSAFVTAALDKGKLAASIAALKKLEISSPQFPNQTGYLSQGVLTTIDVYCVQEVLQPGSIDVVVATMGLSVFATGVPRHLTFREFLKQIEDHAHLKPLELLKSQCSKLVNPYYH